MKKCLSMLMAMGAILFASTLCATDTGVINSENFDGNTSSGAPRFTVGDSLNVNTAYDGDSALYWASTEAEEGGSMGELATVADKGEGDKYLKVETGAPLYRYVNGGGKTEEIGSGLYFEGDVQFSPYEEDVDMSDSEVKNKGTKLLVYLKSTTEGEGTEKESTTYNFVVVAGYYNGRGGSTTTNYVCALPTADFDCSNSAWHKLVIKTYRESNITYFKVLVDGTALTCGDDKGDQDATTYGYTAEKFPSIIATGDNKSTLEAIGFKGSGAIDNIVWTNEDPAPATVQKAYVWENGTFTLTVNGVAKDVVSGTVYDFKETDKVVPSFVADTANGYVYDEELDYKDITDTATGVTTYYYTPVKAKVLLVNGSQEEYVRDFATVITKAAAIRTGVSVKLLDNAEVAETEEGYGVAFATETIFLLNGKTLTVTGTGFYGDANLTIADYSTDAVSADGAIIADVISGDNITVLGGKLSKEPVNQEGSNTYTTPNGYTLKQVGDYWQLVADGGSTEPTIDGDSGATVDPTLKTITVDSNTQAEITIKGDASEYTITVPAKVTKITGTVKDVVIRAEDVVITGAFTVDSTTTSGVTTIALNPEGKVTVNDVEISVTPELVTSSDEVKPFDVASDGVSATVKAIPGLTYQLYASTDVSTVKTAGTAVGDAVTAGATGSVTLKDTSATASAKFYVIRVTR